MFCCRVCCVGFVWQLFCGCVVVYGFVVCAYDLGWFGFCGCLGMLLVFACLGAWFACMGDCGSCCIVLVFCC